MLIDKRRLDKIKEQQRIDTINNLSKSINKTISEDPNKLITHYNIDSIIASTILELNESNRYQKMYKFVIYIF